METKNQNWKQELSDLVKTAQANEEKRLREEAENEFENGYRKTKENKTGGWNEYTGMHYKENGENKFQEIKENKINELAEKKREEKITEIQMLPAYEGKLIGIAKNEINLSMQGNDTTDRKNWNKERIRRAGAALYLTGITEREQNGARKKAMEDIMQEIKTGLEKPENYSLGKVIEDEIAKYLK